MNPNIDVLAQYALFRMFKSAAPEHRRAASNMLSAVKARALKGIYQEDQQVPALRAAIQLRDVALETGAVTVTSAAPLERAAVQSAVAEAGYTLV